MMQGKGIEPLQGPLGGVMARREHGGHGSRAAELAGAFAGGATGARMMRAPTALRRDS